MLLDTYETIWFCGLAASGKTSCLKLIEKFLPKDSVTFFSDSQEIINFVRKDTSFQHHQEPTSGSFILTDSAAVDYSIDQLIQKVSTSGKMNIVELSRGLDKEKIVDFSFAHFFDRFPVSRKCTDLFIYLFASYEQRMAINQGRPPLSHGSPSAFESFQCPQVAFERFFKEDDFSTVVRNNAFEYLFIPNIYSSEHLENRIKHLFGNIRINEKGRAG